MCMGGYAYVNNIDCSSQALLLSIRSVKALLQGGQDKIEAAKPKG